MSRQRTSPLDEIREKLAHIKRLKARVGKVRDEFREAFEDLQILASNLADADDQFDQGLSLIEAALDKISETV
jgi:ABC-type transporter Mla subunit MlaD